MPVPHIPDDKIKSRKQLTEFAGELLDSEVQQVIKIVMELQRKFATRPNTRKVLDQLRDEALTKMSDIGILATLDPAPCFYGEPPVLEIIGKVSGDAIHKDGFDHEQKGYEVKKANVRGETYLGEKEAVNSRKDK